MSYDKQVLETLTYFGMPYRTEYLSEDVAVWDGKQVWLSYIDDYRSDFILHELGHFLVAPKSRKYLPNYGLGISPDGGLSTPKYVNASVRSVEEDRATLLGLLLCGVHKVDLYEAACSVYMYELDFKSFFKSVNKDYKWLKDNGLIPSGANYIYKKIISNYFHKGF